MSQFIKAVETSRKINNSDTGLDIVVPDFVIPQTQETQKAAKAAYHVIVTTDLRYMDETEKNNEEKAENNIGNSAVHYSIDKEFSDFVKLRNDMDKKYSGLYVPKIEVSEKFSSKLGKPNWKTCREKQVAVDNFMKWCAKLPKVAASPLLKDFLGLNILKLSKDEKSLQKASQNSSETKKSKQIYEAEDIFDELDYTKGQKESLFEEEEEEDSDDLFNSSTANTGQQQFALKTETKTRKSHTLFETGDLTGNVPKSDEKMIIFSEEDQEQNLAELQTSENDNDLLDINEDLNDLASQLQKVGDKPKPPRKPKPIPRGSKNAATNDNSASVSVDSMRENDLLNYIKENTEKEDDDDLDLGF